MSPPERLMEIRVSARKLPKILFSPHDGEVAKKKLGSAGEISSQLLRQRSDNGLVRRVMRLHLIAMDGTGS